MKAVQSVLKALPRAPAELVAEVEKISEEVSTIARESQPATGLFGGTMAARFRVADQINMVYAYVEGSTAPPTEDQKRMMHSATEQLGELMDQLNRLVKDVIPALNQKLDQHGVPWTPGRLPT
jgi:hypothetical protein